MRAWFATDAEGRVNSSTTVEEYAGDGFTEVEVDEGFDFSKQGDYKLVDGELVYDGEQTKAEEEARTEAQVQALRSLQLETAATMYVKAAALPRVQAISVCTLYDEWSDQGVTYKKNDWLRYGQDFVRVESDHTSQKGWTPENSPSLYTVFKLAPDGIRIWDTPTHAENSFDVEEKCHYPDANGPIYESLINGNAHSPDVRPDDWKLLV